MEKLLPDPFRKNQNSAYLSSLIKIEHINSLKFYAVFLLYAYSRNYRYNSLGYLKAIKIY